MKCIFCKSCSNKSKNIEHIIPESLGNREHILPAGIVCDQCNQYFGSKIEKFLLESDYFRFARFRTATATKKGNYPPIYPFSWPPGIELEMFINKDLSLGVGARHEKDVKAWIHFLTKCGQGSIIVPMPNFPDERLVSRFLGKVAIEALAQKLLEKNLDLDFVINDKQLDLLKNYVRHGKGPRDWPFSRRRIYSEDHIFSDLVESYEILHEYAFLITDKNEMYLVLSIYGMEYVINCAGPDIEGYQNWLEENNNKSYLSTLEEKK